MNEIQNIKIKEYIVRINLSVEYINNNLDKELNLVKQRLHMLTNSFRGFH